MGYADRVTAKEVEDPETFAQYVSQTTGTPYATKMDMAILKRKLKDFFKQYPHLDYSTLVKTVDWCRARKRRFSNVYLLVDQYRYAWVAGAIPEFSADPESVMLEREITKALEVEKDKEWRYRLAFAVSGVVPPSEARKVYVEWEMKQAS